MLWPNNGIFKMANENKVTNIKDKVAKKQNLTLTILKYDTKIEEFTDFQEIFVNITGYQVNEHFLAIVQEGKTTVLPANFVKIEITDQV